MVLVSTLLVIRDGYLIKFPLYIYGKIVKPCKSGANYAITAPLPKW